MNTGAAQPQAISTGRLDPPDPDVTWLNWVIRLRDEACLTGTVQATISPSSRGHISEIAWVLGTPWQGRGIATEAARGLVDWLSRASDGLR